MIELIGDPPFSKIVISKCEIRGKINKLFNFILADFFFHEIRAYQNSFLFLVRNLILNQYPFEKEAGNQIEYFKGSEEDVGFNSYSEV